MEIRVLGCHGSQLPGYNRTCFLLDRGILLDGGTITSVLTAIIATLRSYLFNGIIWPDFSIIPNAEKPVIKFEALFPGGTISIAGLEMTTINVSHTQIRQIGAL